MNVLDENVPSDQRELLRRWRIAVRHIGHDIGTKGISDEQIIPLLLTLPQPTFFTRDRGFYRRDLCHERYCLVVLHLGDEEVATYSRRLLRHPRFRTRANRMGTILRVAPDSINVLARHLSEPETVNWPQ